MSQSAADIPAEKVVKHEKTQNKVMEGKTYIVKFADVPAEGRKSQFEVIGVNEIVHKPAPDETQNSSLTRSKRKIKTPKRLLDADANSLKISRTSNTFQDKIRGQVTTVLELPRITITSVGKDDLYIEMEIGVEFSVGALELVDKGSEKSKYGCKVTKHVTEVRHQDNVSEPIVSALELVDKGSEKSKYDCKVTKDVTKVRHQDNEGEPIVEEQTGRELPPAKIVTSDALVKKITGKSCQSFNFPKGLTKRQKRREYYLARKVQKAESEAIKSGTHKAESEAVKSETQKAESEAVKSGTQKAESEAVKSGTQKSESEAVKSGTQKAESEAVKSGTQKAESEAVKNGSQKSESEAVKCGTQKAESETVKSGTQKAESEAVKSGTQKAESEAVKSGTQKAESGAVKSGTQKAESEAVRSGTDLDKQEHNEVMEEIDKDLIPETADADATVEAIPGDSQGPGEVDHFENQKTFEEAVQTELDFESEQLELNEVKKTLKQRKGKAQGNGSKLKRNYKRKNADANAADESRPKRKYTKKSAYSHNNLHYTLVTNEGGKKSHKCNFCGLEIRSRGNMRDHIRTHTGEKPFECETCHKRFGNQNSYNLHIACHKSDRPFVCDICGFSFKIKRQLTLHTRRHTSKGTNICQFCGRDFYSTSELKNHLRRHTGERKYVCEFCSRAFSHASSFSRHKLTHTEAGRHQCDECGETFIRRINFRNHLVKKHLIPLESADKMIPRLRNGSTVLKLFEDGTKGKKSWSEEEEDDSDDGEYDLGRPEDDVAVNSVMETEDFSPVEDVVAVNNVVAVNDIQLKGEPVYIQFGENNYPIQYISTSEEGSTLYVETTTGMEVDYNEEKVIVDENNYIHIISEADMNNIGREEVIKQDLEEVEIFVTNS